MSDEIYKKFCIYSKSNFKNSVINSNNPMSKNLKKNSSFSFANAFPAYLFRDSKKKKTHSNKADFR